MVQFLTLKEKEMINFLCIMYGFSLFTVLAVNLIVHYLHHLDLFQHQ